jgi:hypothetical protein
MPSRNAGSVITGSRRHDNYRNKIEDARWPWPADLEFCGLASALLIASAATSSIPDRRRSADARDTTHSQAALPTPPRPATEGHL